MTSIQVNSRSEHKLSVEIQAVLPYMEMCLLVELHMKGTSVFGVRLTNVTISSSLVMMMVV
jgi:hypothetical protein